MTADFRWAVRLEKDHSKQAAVLWGLISLTEGPAVEVVRFSCSVVRGANYPAREIENHLNQRLETNLK